MTERELRRIIKEELKRLEEAKTPDQMRLDDARLSIVSLSTAADMLRRAGTTNASARDMAKELDGMVEKLRSEVVPDLESMTNRSLGSHISSGLGRLASRAVQNFRE